MLTILGLSDVSVSKFSDSFLVEISEVFAFSLRGCLVLLSPKSALIKNQYFLTINPEINPNKNVDEVTRAGFISSGMLLYIRENFYAKM